MTTPTIIGKYQGQLRCLMTHQKSENTIITDAPTDNNGKGAAFSPTDLVAGALASCMLTIIGIRAKTKGIEIEYSDFSVLKKMQNQPRRIETIEIEIKLPQSIKLIHRKYLENEAKNCPVALSLNKDVIQLVRFSYT